jgi:beta-glucanase (GH16 family)
MSRGTIRRRSALVAVTTVVLANIMPTLTSTTSSFASAASVTQSSASGYRLVASDGGIFSYGDAGFYGSAGSLNLNKPIVGLASTPDGGGYWLVASDGGIFSYGDAGFYGSAGNVNLNRPIVGMASTPAGAGYWMVASDGGIFSYGDAGFHGSAGNMRLNKPIVGMASTPDGGGYWLVASDGGIFAYGDAAFYGSAGSVNLNKPIVGMASTPDGGGYWLVASDGGIFSYGDAAFYGSAGSVSLNKPIVGMASTPDGGGYWLVASDGGIFSYGDAAFYGSAGSVNLNTPIVGMATAPPPSQPGMEPPTGFTSRQIIFNDQFFGTALDPTKWNTYISSRAANGAPWNGNGSGGSGGNVGGYNAEYFEPSQVHVNNGLTLTAARGSSQPGYQWTSGVVSTYGKFQFDGGYVQIEARMPGGDGMWPGLWMLPGPGGSHGDDNELDLFEGNYIGNGVSPNDNAAWQLITPSGATGGLADAATDLTAGFHIYGVNWIPGQSVTWYLDGKQIGQVTSAQYPIPNEPMELIIDLQVANSSASGWRTIFDDSTPSPSTMSIAGVQVYS